MAAKRKANGNGSISRLPSGSWRGQLMDGYTMEGKRNIVSFTAPTKGEVQQKIREYLAGKEAGEIVNSSAGEIVNSSKDAFSYWADLWYEDHRDQVQASTYSGYKYTLKLLKKYFGDADVSIKDIKPIDVNRFLNKMIEEGCSASKVTKCRAMLIQILDFAEANDAVRRNAARLAKGIRNIDVMGTTKDAFSEEEVQRLMQELPNDKIGHSIRLLLGTGIRVQELLGSTKQDISEDGSIITIRRAVKMVDGKPEVGTTKSKAGVRIIPIPASYRASALYLREHSGETFIWCSGQKNLVYGTGTFRQWYYKALRKIEGVRLLAPHCCRHTYVSMLSARGVPMERIARLVGHSKITTTDGYLHIETAVLQESVAVLNGEDAA